MAVEPVLQDGASIRRQLPLFADTVEFSLQPANVPTILQHQHLPELLFRCSRVNNNAFVDIPVGIIHQPFVSLRVLVVAVVSSICRTNVVSIVV